ncbi:MAG: helix-turn-helix domain-containing protein [Bacillus sp. (in: Bacteria)]|nr:helix-turn-helix domain-containing protein [Bacillus sp. (in: firmicutes)]
MFAYRLRQLRLGKKLSQQYMADFLGITRQGYGKYEKEKKNGSQPDFDTLKKLADFFDVTIDYLISGDIEKKKDHLPELTDKNEKDIAKKLENILESMESDTALSFDGEPMDDETKELVRMAIESNLKLTKQLAKKKFTPKKYRDDQE